MGNPTKKPSGPSSELRAKRTKTIDELLGVIPMEFEPEIRSE